MLIICEFLGELNLLLTVDIMLEAFTLNDEKLNSISLPHCKSSAANNLTRVKSDSDARRLYAFNYKRKKEAAHCIFEKASIKFVNLF